MVIMRILHRSTFDKVEVSDHPASFSSPFSNQINSLLIIIFSNKQITFQRWNIFRVSLKYPRWKLKMLHRLKTDIQSSKRTLIRRCRRLGIPNGLTKTTGLSLRTIHNICTWSWYFIPSKFAPYFKWSNKGVF